MLGLFSILLMVVHCASTETKAKSPLVVMLDFTGECWVEANADNRKTHIAKLMYRGESLRLEAQQEVILTLGNLPAVEIQVNGQPFSPSPTSDGIVLRNLHIDLETARQLKQDALPPGH